MLWFSRCYRLCREGAFAGAFTDWRQLPATTDYFQSAGFTWRGIAVWDKTHCARGIAGRFRNQCEYIIWGTAGSKKVKYRDGNGKSISPLPGVLQETLKRSEKLHVTGKPMTVMKWILDMTKPGDLILDPFAGSGTTCLATKQTGRRYIGIEFDPHW